MKALFKHTIRSGLTFRGVAFAVIFVLNSIFVTFGSLGKLPLAAQIVAVSLGGLMVTVMFAANIIGDVFILRRMFGSPASYLQMLTPVHRGKILFASVATMAVMDLFSMAFVIAAQTVNALNLAGSGVWEKIGEFIRSNDSYLLYGLWLILLLIAAYLLLVMIILFCITVRKSLFFKMSAAGFLSFLLAIGCFYVVSLLQFALAPFGDVQRHGLMFIITLDSPAVLPVFILLTLLEAAALFFATLKLLERKINL